MTEHQGKILSGKNSYNSWQQRSSRFFSTYLFYLMYGCLEAEGIHTCTSPVCPTICTETLTLRRQQPGPAVPAPEPERGPGSLDAASQGIEKWPRRHITPLYAEMLQHSFSNWDILKTKSNLAGTKVKETGLFQALAYIVIFCNNPKHRIPTMLPD